MQHIAGRGDLVVTRHRNHAVRDVRALRRAAKRGDLIELRSGAFVPVDVWTHLRPSERRRLDVAEAQDAGRSEKVVSHRSAGALWGVPTVQRHDGLVHVRTTERAGTRTEHGYRKHAVREPEQHLVELQGIRCTSLERTVLDIAATEPFAEAVVALDWALRTHTTEDAVRSTLDEMAPKQGRARIERTIAFADARAGSPGESWSRAQMEEAGLVMPLLQQEFSDRLGLIGYVDFYWPEFGVDDA